MPTPLSQIQTDAKAFVRGSWIPIPGTDLRLKIRAVTGDSFAQFCMDHQEESWDDETTQRAYIGGFCILEAENLVSDDGDPMEWTPSLGIELMTASRHIASDDDDEGDPERVFLLEDLYQIASAAAQSRKLYKAALSGNS